MGTDSEARTSPTLLRRVQQEPIDQAAWDEFVQRYGPCIARWCRQWRLQDADAEDVTQDVLLRLVRHLRGFQYDPAGSFRAWLKTVTHHAWRDFLASRQRPAAGSGNSSVLEFLQTIEARDDLVRQLADEFDRDMLEAAMTRVRQRVAPHTFEAFRLLVFEGLSGREAAARVNMQVAMVYVAKSKVQKMLQQEIERLEGHPEAQ